MKQTILVILYSTIPFLQMPATAQEPSDFTYTTNHSAITITGYKGKSGLVTIPRAINGLPVTAIGYQAFQYSTILTNVTLSANVTSCGNFAFDGCSNLLSVTMGPDVTNFEEYAFASCTRLKTVTLPSNLAAIGDHMFTYCGSLITLAIPKGVSSMGSDAFGGCSNLSALFFEGDPPGGVSNLPSNTNLTLYYLPGTRGWTNTFDGRPALLWNPTPKPTTVENNQFAFSITGTISIPIAIEATTDLVKGTWTPLLTGTLTNGLVHFTDPEWTNYPARFYRISSPE